MQESSERIYGINPVFEAVCAGRRKIECVWLNKEGTTNPRQKKLASVLAARNIRIEWTDKGKLFDLCGTREHQGAVLESGPFPYTPYAELLGQPRLLLLDSIEDPHNVGAIMRSAEVFGWKNILLPRRGAPLVSRREGRRGRGRRRIWFCRFDKSGRKYGGDFPLGWWRRRF